MREGGREGRAAQVRLRIRAGNAGARLRVWEGKLFWGGLTGGTILASLARLARWGAGVFSAWQSHPAFCLRLIAAVRGRRRNGSYREQAASKCLLPFFHFAARVGSDYCLFLRVQRLITSGLKIFDRSKIWVWMDLLAMLMKLPNRREKFS